MPNGNHDGTMSVVSTINQQKTSEVWILVENLRMYLSKATLYRVMEIVWGYLIAMWI